MKVSIITVCKNAEHTIEKAIQSVIAQTYNPIEYVVIDGASSDRTFSLIERYQSQIACLISEPDAGIYQAMNKGIHHATGDWLYFLNADDFLYDATVIQDLVEFVQQCPDCEFVYGDHEARFTSGQASIHQPAMPDQMLEEMVTLGNCLIQPASFFRATLFSRLGTFSEAYKIASDYEWFTRLMQDQTSKMCYFNRTIVSYSHGGVSSQIKPLFDEVFDIQNKTPLYQQPHWINTRLHRLQQSFAEKYDALERTHYLAIARQQRIEQLKTRQEALRAENETLKAELEAMKSSKFWTLRRYWFGLRHRLGIPGD